VYEICIMKQSYFVAPLRKVNSAAISLRLVRGCCLGDRGKFQEERISRACASTGRSLNTKVSQRERRTLK